MSAPRLDSEQTRARLRRIGLETARSRAFSFAEDSKRIAYDFHAHRQHQVLYAIRGAARLESKSAQFILPPQRAAWIPAGLRHATHLDGAEVISVYFERKLADRGDQVLVFEVSPLVREMLLYSRRWPPSRKARDANANAYFRALLLVLLESMRPDAVYALPRARSRSVARAMQWVLSHLPRVNLSDAARSAGASPRTLRRRFIEETGLSFRAFVGQARMQRAIELLADRQHSILDVALAVGFESQSAFSQAFRKATGETPRAFRAVRAFTAARPASNTYST
jgi:AraC-like DNA-binding protein